MDLCEILRKAEEKDRKIVEGVSGFVKARFAVGKTWKGMKAYQSYVEYCKQEKIEPTGRIIFYRKMIRQPLIAERRIDGKVYFVRKERKVRNYDFLKRDRS